MFKNILLIAVILASGSAQAIPTLTFSPSSTSVQLGTQVAVDVVVNDLEPEFVSGYDLTFTYDSSILSIFNASFTDLDGLFSDISVLGEVTWNSSNFTLDDAQLSASQGNSLTLASIVFDTIGLGTSALSFSYDDLTGSTPATALFPDALAHNTDSGSITVTSQSNTVPEPATMLLLGFGALGIVGTKRRKASLADV